MDIGKSQVYLVQQYVTMVVVNKIYIVPFDRPKEMRWNNFRTSFVEQRLKL